MPTADPRVLFIEDDELIRASVTDALTDRGYAVLALPDGTDAVAEAERFRPDLALLDITLPGPSGFQIARALRRESDVALLFLTARDALDDRLNGFELGADDYVVKPFLTEELIARVGAILRRRGVQPSTLQLGDLVIDGAANLVRRAGVPVELTGTEYRLLEYLAENRGRILSKTQLLTQVWGYDEYDPNLVEVYVSALRRKLDPLGPRLLHTVRGLGYVLRPVEPDAVGSSRVESDAVGTVTAPSAAEEPAAVQPEPSR